MKILSIDTSCDETAAAVTEDNRVLSNTIWSQAALHAKFGGVMPSLAQRQHEEHIDWVVSKAIKSSGLDLGDIDAVAITVGPGLSIALGVGVNKAKEIAKEIDKPLIPINHIEAHLLSAFAGSKSQTLNHEPIQFSKFQFPCYGFVVSGGNTIFVLIENVGQYKILAQTVDDALGEALDKGARMLGLGYPGGAVLEKMAKLGDSTKYKLPTPLVGQENRKIFSYSGLKTSFYRLIQSRPPETKQNVYDLAATFQDTAFRHIERVLAFVIQNSNNNIQHFLLGGGVSANVELRRRLRKLGHLYGFNLAIPYTKRLTGDNAAMIGVCAYLKIMNENLNLGQYKNYDNIDRNPRLKLNEKQ